MWSWMLNVTTASLLVLGTVERVVSEKCFWTLRYV